MKLLLGINLLLIVVVSTFLLLREDRRAPDQTLIPRVTTHQEGPAPAKARPEATDDSPRSEVAPQTTPKGPEDTREPKTGTTAADPGLTIDGVVLTPDGKPMSHILVQAKGPGDESGYVTGDLTDEKGRFRFSVKEPGSYRLSGQDLMRAIREQVLVSPVLQVHAGEHDVRLQLQVGKSGSIHAILGGFGDIGIPDRIQVILENLDPTGTTYHRIVDCPKGRMQVEDVAPGKYEMEFYVPDLLVDAPTVSVVENQVADLGRLHFYPEGAIAGWLLDSKGRPLAGVSVHAKRPYTGWLHPTDPSIREPRPSTVTDASGRFWTTGFRAPWTPITFTRKGFAPIEIQLTSADQARTLRLRLEPAGTLVISTPPQSTTVEGKDTPLTHWRLRATRLPESYSIGKGHPLLDPGIRQVLSRDRKDITVHDLPPGDYELELFTQWEKGVVLRRFHLTGGKTHEVTWK